MSHPNRYEALARERKVAAIVRALYRHGAELFGVDPRQDPAGMAERLSSLPRDAWLRLAAFATGKPQTKPPSTETQDAVIACLTESAEDAALDAILPVVTRPAPASEEPEANEPAVDLHDGWRLPLSGYALTVLALEGLAAARAVLA